MLGCAGACVQSGAAGCVFEGDCDVASNWRRCTLGMSIVLGDVRSMNGYMLRVFTRFQGKIWRAANLGSEHLS